MREPLISKTADGCCLITCDLVVTGPWLDKLTQGHLSLHAHIDI